VTKIWGIKRDLVVRGGSVVCIQHACTHIVAIWGFLFLIHICTSYRIMLLCIAVCKIVRFWR